MQNKLYQEKKLVTQDCSKRKNQRHSWKCKFSHLDVEWIGKTDVHPKSSNMVFFVALIVKE